MAHGKFNATYYHIKEILNSKPEFLKEMQLTCSTFARIDQPYLLEKMLVRPRQYLMTWARFDHIPEGVVSEKEWLAEGRQLWCVEFVPFAGTNIAGAVRQCKRDLLNAGIAKNGEKCLMWRHRTQRYGSFIVEDRHGRTIRVEGSDIEDGERSTQERTTVAP